MLYYIYQFLFKNIVSPATFVKTKSNIDAVKCLRNINNIYTVDYVSVNNYTESSLFNKKKQKKTWVNLQ